MTKSFYKHWFTYTNGNNEVDLFFSCLDNYYIKGWFESRGYDSFKNTIKLSDINDFLHAINNSSKKSHFVLDFPDEYIKGYDLYYKIHTKFHYLPDINDYKKYILKEMVELIEPLSEAIQNIETLKRGTIEYNTFCNY